MSESTGVVLGLAGGSGAGKTTVLRHIINHFGRETIAVLDHDAYYVDLSDRPLDERQDFNFDHPAALETDLMRRHLDALRDGRSIEKPVYDFTTHSRSAASTIVHPRAVIIVEGILVLAEPLLLERMDIRIFVDADDDVRLIRRIRRDITERGRTIDSVLDQYERTVRPMHLEFVQPSMREADVIIPRGGRNRVAIEMVIARIESLLSRTSAEY